MRKILAWVLLALALFALTACGQKEEPATLGGWTLTEELTIDQKAQGAFDKALEGLTGVDYVPLGLLGTQLVSGTNYCFLCEATVVYPGAQPYYALVYVYEDLQGGAKILNIVALDLGDIAETGAVNDVPPAGEQLLGGWQVDRESSVEIEGAALHLGSQTVSGKNHCVLCKSWALSFLYEDLEGTTTVTKIVPLDIAALSQPAGA